MKRNGAEYIHDTLSSLYNKSTPNERNQTCILIFLADIDPEYNRNVSNQIQRNHKEQLESGFFLIVTIGQHFYPKLHQLKHNFGDSEDRVTWRSKQVVDYVFMMLYSCGMSDYYMQLEDDVIAADDYLIHIRHFITIKKRRKWSMLEFFSFGFIGKLFKDEDLLDLATFFWIFYDEQPIDLLLSYFLKIRAQEGQFLRKPTLFQHMGIISSLSDKISLIQDKHFSSTHNDIKELRAFAKEKRYFKRRYHLGKDDNVIMLQKSVSKNWDEFIKSHNRPT